MGHWKKNALIIFAYAYENVVSTRIKASSRVTTQQVTITHKRDNIIIHKAQNLTGEGYQFDSFNLKFIAKFIKFKM